jgi:hypothetical protein
LKYIINRHGLRFFEEMTCCMKRFLHTLLLILPASFALAQEPIKFNDDIVRAPGLRDTTWRYMVLTDQIHLHGLDTLPQTQFWRKIINLSPDSGLLNLGYDRTVYGTYSNKAWASLGDSGQVHFRDSLRVVHQLSDSARIFFTNGKNNFYDVNAVIPQIDRAIPIFQREGVDPFYAQAILLIECPGKALKSNAGALGAFQLMRGVAINMGLKVNKKVDERKDFDKSAWAAAKLIRTICIPYTNAMLEKRGIAYKQSDLWYRLLVLHVYHAGAGNVDKVLTVIDPCEGNIDLIKTIWHTKAGNFGNSSQNYSQVALAALLELEALMSPSYVKPEESGVQTK